MSAGTVPGMKHDFLATAGLLGVGATLRKPFSADQLLDAAQPHPMAEDRCADAVYEPRRIDGRDARDGGVGERLGHEHGPHREASEHVAAVPPPPTLSR